jgi:anti-sigma factor RsiW
VTDHHPTAHQLERYVIGALDAPDASAVEEHVASCPSCAAALACEARLEVAIREVARAPTPLHQRAERSRIPIALAGAVAVLASAAVLVLLLRPATNAEQSQLTASPAAATIDRPSPQREVSPMPASSDVCLDTDDLDRCIQAAHRRGRAITYPIVDVPRYEYTAAEQLR